MDYMNGLSEVQKEGVLKTGGPCMIIAGAGSGKTKVITTRIAHLIKSCEVQPFQIMALTFTNKAALEMKERIASIVGEGARNIWMGTFHSIFARILKIEAEHLNFDPDFTIYDNQDSKTLISSIIKEKKLNQETYNPNSIISRISSAKNMLIGSEIYAKKEEYLESDKKSQKPLLFEIYAEYTKRCKKANAMDFDDLLYYTNVLFRDFPKILEKYQDMFHYLLVDEFQDTNISQYLITIKLVKKHRNICVVGDDAQSIYSFRGANIQNILNFEKEFEDLHTIRLEQNYRSTKNIVNLANNIIAKNKRQHKKNLWTENNLGNEILVLKATNERDEVKIILQSIIENKKKQNTPYKQMAVLYRQNKQSYLFENDLKKMNIPYKIYGGISFYQRVEVKDIIAYLRLIVNPDDQEAFRRIVNKPARGIGINSLNLIFKKMNESDDSLMKVLSYANMFIKGNRGNTILRFYYLIENFKKQSEKLNAYEIAQLVADESGLKNKLMEDKTIEGESKYENLIEFLSSIKRYVSESNSVGIQPSLSSFLQSIALLTNQDREVTEEDDYVTLMTIHMSKGLEFDVIYIVGLEKDVIPSYRAYTPEQLEEERRLFYVATTRARKKLFLSYAIGRFKRGSFVRTEPSLFLNEIDEGLVQVPKFGIIKKAVFKRPRIPQSFSSGFTSKVWKKNKLKKISNDNEITSNNSLEASDNSKIKVGMFVKHQKFGLGEVLKIEQSSLNHRAVVNFKDYGMKTLLLAFVKLKIIND